MEHARQRMTSHVQGHTAEEMMEREVSRGSGFWARLLLPALAAASHSALPHWTRLMQSQS